MPDDIARDLGRLEGKTDMVLASLQRLDSRFEDIDQQFKAMDHRMTSIERVHDRVKWTVAGVMMAGSAIGAAVSAFGILVWKWLGLSQ